jgi:signal transduction histidine kinase
VLFRVSIQQGLPQKLFSDPEKLEQILLNLLLNAQKFTPKGWIKFKVIKVYPKKANPLNESPSNKNMDNS